MPRPLSIALVGAGGFGFFHLKGIQALCRERDVELVAVVDPAIEKMAAENPELSAPGIKHYSDYRDLAQSGDKLDAVTIAAPIPLHDEMAHAFLASGAFIYLEKPPVPLIQQLDALIAADKNARISVGFQQIASGWVQQIKRWLTSGELGTPEHIRVAACWPRLDNYYQRSSWAGKMTLGQRPVFDGPATNALAHLLHNVMYWAGEGMDNFAVPVQVQGELYRARPIESYDVCSLRGAFASGLEFAATLTHATEKSLPFRLEIKGSKGWAKVSDDGRRMTSSLGDFDYGQEGLGDDRLIHSYRPFLDWVEGKRDRPTTRLSDTRGYVLATNGALQSSGGIHDIGAEHFRLYTRDHFGGYDVNGLREAVEGSLSSGQLLSEMNLPWTKSGSVVPLPSS